MAKRKAAALVLASGSLLGTLVFRRRRRQHQTRLDLYFDDGSMVSLGDDAPEAGDAIAAAHEILAAT